MRPYELQSKLGLLFRTFKIFFNIFIRVSSNIIDSTLAHAESNDRYDGDSGSSSSSSSAIRRELLNEVEETLNISNSSSIGSPPNLENFFSTTIDEFRSLALSNIAESDNDSDDDDDVR